MKIAYFDCFSGISGDMAIAAFLDAGLSLDALSKELKKLKVSGYALKKTKVKRGELAGTKFDCIAAGTPHAHRSLKEILAIIDKSRLSGTVKALAKDIFERIGAAEARVHGIAKGKDVHLHELGDIDSIIDIVGIAIAIDALGIDEIYASNINMGRTFVNSKHGILPIPGPATLELLRGVPVTIVKTEAELVTPTGAGILRSTVKSFGEMPLMKISKIGYGAGSRDIEGAPNMLRVIIGESEPSFKRDKVIVVETNIDDMNPQHFEYLFERLFKEGALDVYTTPINMKKSRPAFKLAVLTEPSKLERISEIIFRETTSIGVRFYETGRYKLERKTTKVNTRFGPIDVKLSSGPGGIFTASPEYEECARAARSKGVPLKAVYEEARSFFKSRVK